MEQLRIKDHTRQQERQQEDMYTKLWYEDIEAKARREEADTQRIMSGNKEMLEVLQQQMAALEAQKQEEKKLVEEEALLLVSDTLYLFTCFQSGNKYDLEAEHTMFAFKDLLYVLFFPV